MTAHAPTHAPRYGITSAPLQVVGNVAIALSLLCGLLTAAAQGTIKFNNRVTLEGVLAPVTYQGQGVMGPDYLGQLFALRTDTDSFEPLGNPTAFH
ncbi:MAG: hypothetical protein RI897_506 [Verrucomicrobiota bacterium]|jgi:hypothetical protein